MFCIIMTSKKSSLERKRLRSSRKEEMLVGESEDINGFPELVSKDRSFKPRIKFLLIYSREMSILGDSFQSCAGRNRLVPGLF